MNNFNKITNFSPTAQQPNKINFNRLFPFCLALFLLISFQSINAQCKVHTRDGGSTSSGICDANETIGQVFTTCQDGEITSISVTHTTSFNILGDAGTYELYLAIEPNSGNSIPATAVASEILGVAPTDGQIMTFNLGTPFSVLDNGTLYRFVIVNTTGNASLAIQGPSDYSGGDYVSHNNTYSTTFDLDFEINIQPSSSTPSGIPTLSEWGLIILALSFMILGTLYLVQPKFRGEFFEQER